MGKYATYRMRGGGQSLLPPLGPPPAPLCFIDLLNLYSLSTSVDNTGGMSQLWYSIDGLVEYAVYASEGWCTPIDWGYTESFPEGYYKSNELGNEVDYSGSSPFSEIVQLTHD